MNGIPSPTTLPNSTCSTFTDPYEHQLAIRASDVRLTVTSAGEYHANLTRIDLHRLWMQRGWESLPRIARTVIHKTRSPIFFLTNDRAPIRHGGMELAPGEIVFTSPGSDPHHRTTGETSWGSMSLTPEDLTAAGRALVGYDIAAPAVTRLIRPTPASMSRLLHLHEAAGRLAAIAPDILAHSEVARAMEQALVSAMIGCLTGDMTVKVASLGYQRVPIMRRFEQVLEENEGRTLYLAEMCEAIGVVDRTLRLHCQEHLGMSPHRYLWLRRMHIAQRALALADPRATTVTVIATDHGFGELGRFAVAYRKLFGEMPSATLRCSPDSRPNIQNQAFR